MLRRAFPVLVFFLAIGTACGEPQPGDGDGGSDAGALDLHRRLGQGEVVAGVLGEDGPFVDHPLRNAAPGDFLLKNSKVWFVIETTEPSDGYLPYAGGIVDADLVREEGEAGYDPFKEFHPIVGLAPVEPESLEIVNDGSDGNPAVVRMIGREGVLELLTDILGFEPTAMGFSIEVDYILAPDSGALEIVTRVWNEAGGTVEASAGDFGFLADGEARPFQLPGGFDGDGHSIRPQVLGSVGEVRPWAMAVFGEEAPLEILGGGAIGGVLGGDSSTVWAYTAGTAALRPGEMLEARRFLSLGRDISEVLAPRVATPGVLSGTVQVAGAPLPGARVTFLSAGAFAGQAVTGADGRYSAVLAPGAYEVIATGEGNGEEVEVPGRPRPLAEGHAPSAPATVTVAGETSLDLSLESPGRVRVRVEDPEGALIPAKITFVSEEARDAPRALIGESRPYASRGVQKIFWTGDGEVEGAIRPGRYTVTASRGFAWELDTQSGVEVPAGGLRELTLVLAPSVDTSGHLAMDSHVHTELSPDGNIPMAERLVTLAAEGVEVHIATEHDRILDFRPLVAELGLRPVLLSVPGDEVSTLQNGHHNAWPLIPDAALANNGAPRWWTGMSIAEAYDAARAQGAQVLQVNHGVGSNGYFDGAGYDVLTGMPAYPERFTFGFDSMEVHNGKGTGRNEELVSIWYSLLNHGRRIAPTAVSDSHQRIPEVGSGRTFVQVEGDDVGVAESQALVDGVLALQTVASTGAFVRFSTTAGQGLGELVTPAAGEAVRLSFEVFAATWMRLERVQLVANGEVIETWDAASTPALTAPASPADTVWLSHEVAVSPAVDTWYAIRVDSSVELAPVYPGLSPFALTSPIFVDADRSGAFDPPG